MRTRLASRLGTPVSEIGLGCWQLGAADWGDVYRKLAQHGGDDVRSEATALGVTFGDAEALIVEQGQNLRLHAFDLRQRRRLGVQSREELRDGAGVSGRADQYSKAVVKNFADQSFVAG